MSRKSPRLMNGGIVLDEETTRRVRVFCARVGKIATQRRLGIAASTLDAIRNRGRVQERVRERLLAALEREERIDEEAPR